MTVRFDPFSDPWPAEAPSEARAAQARERNHRPATWRQVKAEATTQDARAVTETATRRRKALVASLRAQRLKREIEPDGPPASPGPDE